MAEWLRRWTANPLGSARVGSNPILVDLLPPVNVMWDIQVRIPVAPVGKTQVKRKFDIR